jgi:hypothetical protein
VLLLTILAGIVALELVAHDARARVFHVLAIADLAVIPAWLGVFAFSRGRVRKERNWVAQEKRKGMFMQVRCSLLQAQSQLT